MAFYGNADLAEIGREVESYIRVLWHSLCVQRKEIAALPDDPDTWIGNAVVPSPRKSYQRAADRTRDQLKLFLNLRRQGLPYRRWQVNL